VSKKRIGQLAILVAALGIFFLLSRSWPRDQVLHFSFGDAAARVEELHVDYGEHAASSREASRAVDFRYAKGQAPRIVTHEARLPNGEYDVEITLFAGGATRSVTKRVLLDGGSTTIDLSRDVPP
jgi:hypothetical protein